MDGKGVAQKDIDVDKIRTCARRTYLMPIFDEDSSQTP